MTMWTTPTHSRPQRSNKPPTRGLFGSGHRALSPVSARNVITVPRPMSNFGRFRCGRALRLDGEVA